MVSFMRINYSKIFRANEKFAVEKNKNSAYIRLRNIQSSCIKLMLAQFIMDIQQQVKDYIPSSEMFHRIYRFLNEALHFARR